MWEHMWERPWFQGNAGEGCSEDLLLSVLIATLFSMLVDGSFHTPSLTFPYAPNSTKSKKITHTE